MNKEVIAPIRRHLRGFRRIESALAGGTTDPEGVQQLSLSERQFTKLRGRVTEEGASGRDLQGRGRSSNRRLRDGGTEAYQGTAQETIRRVQRRSRPRATCGASQRDLLQTGSTIGDASGKIVALRFEATEDLAGYLDLFETMFREKGVLGLGRHRPARRVLRGPPPAKHRRAARAERTAVQPGRARRGEHHAHLPALPADSQTCRKALPAFTHQEGRSPGVWPHDGDRVTFLLGGRGDTLA